MVNTKKDKFSDHITDVHKDLFFFLKKKYKLKPTSRVDKNKSEMISKVLSKYPNIAKKKPYADDFKHCYVPVFIPGKSKDSQVYYLVRKKEEKDYVAVFKDKISSDSYVSSNEGSFLIDVVEGEFQQPGDLDDKFFKRKKIYNEKFVDKYFSEATPEEKEYQVQTMSRSMFIQTPFSNSFFPTIKDGVISKFLKDNQQRIVDLVRTSFYKLIEDVDYVDTYINKSTSPGVRFINGGEILPSSSFNVSIFVDGRLEKNFHDYSDIKKYYVKKGTENLEKLLDRDYNKNPILDSDFENFCSTVVIYGSRGNNFDRILKDYLTKDRTVFYSDKGDIYEFNFKQTDYREFLDSKWPFFKDLTNDRKTSTRFRLIGAVNAAYNARFYPICRALMHKFEKSPRHFINTNDDLKVDFKQFCDKYKPECIVNIDQSQCDRIMSGFIEIVMACLPDVKLIQTAGKNWIVYLGDNIYTTLEAMFSGVAWTTLCNFSWSLVKHSMLLTMYNIGRLEFHEFAKNFGKVFNFFLCRSDSVKCKPLDSKDTINLYLFLPTDNMDASYERITNHMKRVLELFKREFQMNYEIGKSGESFGCVMDINGTISESKKNLAEKIWFTENPTGAGHGIFKFTCREELFPGMFDLLCEVDSDLYGNGMNPYMYKALYIYLRNSFISALKSENITVDSLINGYSLASKYEYKVFVGEGITDDIKDVTSMNEFLCKDSKIEESIIRENLRILKCNYFRDSESRKKEAFSMYEQYVLNNAA